jgi:MoxR-like ATPase
LDQAGESVSGMSLAEAGMVANRLAAGMNNVVLGREDVVEMITIALLAGGHVLLEDYPGSGKTLLAKALGESIDAHQAHHQMASFRRIQFTPDLLPSDITGASIFDPERAAFEFRPGPVFAHIVLADEINRTSPKVQSALLEAMAERQVTIDNVTHRLDELFLVIATQNPLGMEGTFPLPTPQLDRFLFKLRMEHIRREAELRVLASFRDRARTTTTQRPQIRRDEILAARAAILDQVEVAPIVQETLLDIAQRVRDDERVRQGISTRALVQAIPALQTRALLRQRDFVSSDDLEAMLVPLFAHRLMLAGGVDDPAGIVRQASSLPLENAARYTLRQ